VKPKNDRLSFKVFVLLLLAIIIAVISVSELALVTSNRTFVDHTFSVFPEITALKQGPDLIIAANLSVQGIQGITLEKFYLRGSNASEPITYMKDAIAQEDIDGLSITLNGTIYDRSQNLNWKIEPTSSVSAVLRVPNFEDFMAGDYVVMSFVFNTGGSSASNGIYEYQAISYSGITRHGELTD